MLAYIHTQVAVDGRVMMPPTHAYTHSCLPLILRSWGEWWCRTHTNIYTHPCLPLILRSYPLPYIHTQVVVYWRVGWWWHTPIPMPTLDCLHRHIFLLMFTGAFPLHACGVTRKLRTYFTSVQRVFLVETVVLQTALWDIRAWSARFLVQYVPVA